MSDKGSEADYTGYKDKPTTPLQQHFADWIRDKTGYDPNAAKSKVDAFTRGVALGTALRHQHQSSPENVAARDERAREAAARAAEAAPKEPRKPRAAKAKPAPVEAPAATAPVKRSPRKAKAAAAAAKTGESPF